MSRYAPSAAREREAIVTWLRKAICQEMAKPQRTPTFADTALKTIVDGINQGVHLQREVD